MHRTGGSMDNKDNQTDEMLKAYEADKERRSIREDELQAAKDYLGVLLKEIEDKNKELEDKKVEAEKLADALKRSEVEKQEEVNAGNEARESVRNKSIWIGIAIIEFLAIVAVLVSLFVVYGNLKSDYEARIEELEKQNSEKVVEATPTVSPDMVPHKIKENLAEAVEASLSKLKDGFKCAVETIDGLEYLVFSKGDFKVCYKNEFYNTDKNFKNAVIIEKGDKRIYEHIDYDIEGDISVLCPSICKIGSTELAMVSDYTGFGKMPELFRLYDMTTLAEYYGDDIKAKINSLYSLAFPEGVTGLADYPILLQLSTSKAEYRYGLTDAGFSEIGYTGTVAAGEEKGDISTEFRFETGEEGMTWKTVIRLGRKYCLGELKGELALGNGSVVINNARFGAYAPANTEDPALNGIIIPAESIPERYITINGNNSERYYITIDDNVPECKYDWSRLNTEDPNNWIYTDENGVRASIRGIDVSKYQGKIDWKQVAASGVEFAIIRMGYRGMNEGTLEFDPYFETNMRGASEAGLKVGVYFFSQAVNTEEAIEEANFVSGALSRYDLDYPVIFDTEKVTTFKARANDLSRDERTDICIAFCDRIAKNGYMPMIYANTKYMIMGIDLARLEKYDKWYAIYSSAITFPYDFQMLQYSESGIGDGFPAYGR